MEPPSDSGRGSSGCREHGRFTSGAAPKSRADASCGADASAIRAHDSNPAICTRRSLALWGICRRGGDSTPAAETADSSSVASHRPRQQAYVGVDAGKPSEQRYNVRGAPQATFLGAGWAALLLVRVEPDASDDCWRPMTGAASSVCLALCLGQRQMSRRSVVLHQLAIHAADSCVKLLSMAAQVCTTIMTICAAVTAFSLAIRPVLEVR